jgi:hypothetical protein
MPIVSLRAFLAIGACLVATGPALSAPPSATLDVLHQDLLAIKTSVDALRAVAPGKPSDVVITIAFTDQCGSGFGNRMSSRLVPGGPPQAFSVPAGSAYMVTGVGFASTIAAGQWARFVMRQENSGIVLGEGTMVNPTAGSVPMASHFSFPSPIRFTTAAPCVDLDGSLGNTRLWVYGYLVKDQ